MANVLLVIHVLAAIAIVVLVLLQQGRGADMGAAFGGGSQTLFGSRGSATFLSRVTTWLVALFFLTSMGLAYLFTQASNVRSVTEETVPQTTPSQPLQDIPTVPDSSPTQEQGEVPSVPGPPDSGAAGNEQQTPGSETPRTQ